MKRVYLSGQMRGLPDNNLAEFKEVGRQLAERGLSVMNPAFTRHGENGTRHEYLREDALMLLVSDIVYVLPSWVNSPGARWEVATAWGFGIPVFEIQFDTRTWNTTIDLVPLEAYSVVIPREDQYHEKRKLIGLCGFARAGKDTFASALQGWDRVAFADPLKALAKSCGWNGQKDEVGRKFLQDLGVGVRDHLDPGAWVRAGEEAIDRAKNPVVVTDCRFPNEITMVKRRGGILIWIERTGVQAANAHVSEHSVTPADCDLKYLNDAPLDEVQTSVRKFMEAENLAHNTNQN